MAIVVDNIYTKGISGRIGDDLLYKQYGNKTVVCRFPRRSLKPPTSKQLAQRQKFALAVFKTRTWLANKAKRIFLEGLQRKWDAHSTYHAGITYFMNQRLKVGSQNLEIRNQRLEGGRDAYLRLTKQEEANTPQPTKGDHGQPDHNPQTFTRPKGEP